MDDKIVDIDFLEKMIIKAISTNERYCSMVLSSIDKTLFENQDASRIFEKINTYFRQYKQLPERNIILSYFSDENEKKDIENYYKEIESIDFSIEKNYDFLLDQTDKWLKSSALRNAIIDSVKILENNSYDNFGTINTKIKDALCRTIKFDLGTDYFATLGSRLSEMFNLEETKIPSYYPTFDEMIAGGFPKSTLSVILSKTHGRKIKYNVKYGWQTSNAWTKCLCFYIRNVRKNDCATY